MLAKKAPRQDIPKSNNNTLYFVDHSFAQFAKSYDPGKVGVTKSAPEAGSSTNSCNNASGDKGQAASK